LTSSKGLVQAELDSLIADFNDYPGLPAALCEIARRYESSGKHEEAKGVYQQIIQRYPDSPQADRAQLDVSRVNILGFIRSGRDADAEAAVDKLIADFNDQPGLPGVISKIEEGYYIRILAAETWVRGNYLHPVKIWEKVMSKFPDFFHGDPDLYYFIACCYYQLGEYDKAIEYYSVVIDNWPDHRNARGAQRLMETCLERLINAEK